MMLGCCVGYAQSPLKKVGISDNSHLGNRLIFENLNSEGLTKGRAGPLGSL